MKGLAAVVVLVAVLAVMPASATAQSDLSPPQTSITDAPSNPTSERTATFAFTGTDDTTAPDELEFECRLDSTDENLWVECLSPQFFQGLLAGQHTFEVRALDAEENIDPTPARYTWTVLPPATCAQAGASVPAVADSWINESSPLDNKGDDGTLIVQSKSPASNTRALVRFALPATPPGCVVASASLRLFSDKPAEFPRTLHAYRVASAWGENNVTWANRPATAGGPAGASSGTTPLAFNVASQVQAIYSGAPNNGFLIRDSAENDIDGPETKLFSRENLEFPPELVLSFRGRAGGRPGAAVPSPATRGRIRSTLGGNLRGAARALRRVGIRGLLRRRGVSVRNVRAATAGTLRMDAVATVRGKRIAVLRGRRAFGRAGRGTLRLRLTSRGRRVLRPRRKVRLRLRGSFTTRGGHRSRGSRAVTLTRRGRR